MRSKNKYCDNSDFLLLYFQMIYKAQSKEEMAKVTTTVDSVDIKRAKWAQQLTNKVQTHHESVNV